MEVIFTEYVNINTQNREHINSFIAEHWFSTDMIIRGTIIDMTKVDGIVALENNDIIGLLTYTIHENVCEITSLDSLLRGKGIGTTLINKLLSIAKEANCNKVIVVTTNDNINAIRFYQKRGFDMARLYHNALDISRKMKPSIPLIGDNGIPLKHEIEFEIDFTK
jgi:ribosomal protein S18 acetylase RimI-like enzyme